MEYKKSLHLAFGIQDELRVPLTLFRGLELQSAVVFIHERGRMDPLWTCKEGPATRIQSFVNMALAFWTVEGF